MALQEFGVIQRETTTPEQRYNASLQAFKTTGRIIVDHKYNLDEAPQILTNLFSYELRLVACDLESWFRTDQSRRNKLDKEYLLSSVLTEAKRGIYIREKSYALQVAKAPQGKYLELNRSDLEVSVAIGHIVELVPDIGPRSVGAKNPWGEDQKFLEAYEEERQTEERLDHS